MIDKKLEITEKIKPNTMDNKPTSSKVFSAWFSFSNVAPIIAGIFYDIGGFSFAIFMVGFSFIFLRIGYGFMVKRLPDEKRKV